MSAALETALEWPRFCYTGPSMFEDSLTSEKNRKRTKLSPQQNNKRLSSSSNNTESDGETGSMKDEQMVPNSKSPNAQTKLNNSTPIIRSEFAFSDLMRKMASKYQQPTPAPTSDASKTSIGKNPSFTDAFTAALSQFQAAAAAGAAPFGHRAAPTPGFLPTPPFMPFAHLTPALETLAGSRALTALAHAQKRLREQSEDEEIQRNAAKKCRIIENDPLDLSYSTSEEDVDVLSIDSPPSPSNVEQWSVEKVVEFISNVESCRDYAQVFFEHSIDGSALLVLNESHLTRIMGLKLGPAIRLRNAIQELKNITNCD